MVDNYPVKLSNIDKVFWPELNLLKNDLINYYIEIYPYICRYLKNRPLSLKIYPDGIAGKSFYQKNCPDHAPDWLSQFPLPAHHNRDIINWICINKLADLVWVANRASIELHGWCSTTIHPHKPDFAVFDLDPGENTGFKTLVEVALLIRELLTGLNLKSFVKTSGKSGLHVYLPLKPIYSYSQVRQFLKSIADIIIRQLPETTTIEWRINKRKGKLYIDYRQNGRGKTLPAPYSLRPTPRATVSAPLFWEEVTTQLQPTIFNLNSIRERLATKGDPWSKMLDNRQLLPG